MKIDLQRTMKNVCNIEAFTKTKTKYQTTKCMSQYLEFQHFDHLKIPETNKDPKTPIENSKHLIKEVRYQRE